MVWRRWPQLAAKHSSTHLEYHQHLEGSPAWATRCLSLVSIAMINAMNKSNLGRAGYTSAYSCAPWGEVKEPWGRNLNRGRGGPSSTTCLGVVQLRELGSPIPIINQDNTTQTCLQIFPNYNSLPPDMSRLCEAGKNHPAHRARTCLQTKWDYSLQAFWCIYTNSESYLSYTYKNFVFSIIYS